jgi:hypothetical protein
MQIVSQLTLSRYYVDLTQVTTKPDTDLLPIIWHVGTASSISIYQ